MSAPLSGISPLNVLGTGAASFALDPMQQAFSLKPGLASEALGQVTMGQMGLSHLSRPGSPLGLQPLNGLARHSDAEVRQVAKNFESLFLQMLMKEMRNSVQRSGFMGNSRGMEFFESMYDDQLTQKLSSAGGIGLGKMIYDKLKTATSPHIRTFS